MNFTLKAASFIAFTSAVAMGAPIQIYNTGVDANGTVLAAGSVDSHYSAVSPTSASAYVLGAIATLPATWIVNTPVSSWIGIDISNGSSVNSGNYTRTYRMTFDLAGLDSNTAQIAGRWAVDNTGSMYLNGSLISTATGFSSFTSFSANSGFVEGTNTLDVVFVNQGGPGGIRVEVSGTAEAIPEPGTMFLLCGGAGLLFAGKFCRERRAIKTRSTTIAGR